VEEVLNQ